MNFTYDSRTNCYLNVTTLLENEVVAFKANPVVGRSQYNTLTDPFASHNVHPQLYLDMVAYLASTSNLSFFTLPSLLFSKCKMRVTPVAIDTNPMGYKVLSEVPINQFPSYLKSSIIPMRTPVVVPTPEIE